MAEKILAALEKPFVIEGQSLEVSASIGIALCPQDGDDWTTLLRCADVAMYAAKQSSEGYVVYSASDDTYGESGFTLMRELRAGVDGKQLHLDYQPQVRMRDGRIGAVEALVRWRHPRRGDAAARPVPPGGRTDRHDQAGLRVGARSGRSRTAAAGTTRAFRCTSP